MSHTNKELSRQQPHTLQVRPARTAGRLSGLAALSSNVEQFRLHDGTAPCCSVPPAATACRRCRLPPAAAHCLPFPPACPCYQVVCRRLPEEVARVTQTLQLDVEELFANLLDWDTPKPAPKAEQQAWAQPSAQQQQQEQHGEQQQQAQPQDAAASSEQQPAAVDSKKLCGNVDSDQPGRLPADHGN